MRNACPQDSSCDWRFNSYFFYIAVENTVCREYITEKFWGRLHLHTVPIVMRRHVYEGRAPANSFIAMDDYADPKEMATHLKRIMNSPDEYMKYFEWKAKGWAKVPFNLEGYRIGFCQLCEKLLKRKEERKMGIAKPLPVIKNITHWFLEETVEVRASSPQSLLPAANRPPDSRQKALSVTKEVRNIGPGPRISPGTD